MNQFSRSLVTHIRDFCEDTATLSSFVVWKYASAERNQLWVLSSISSPILGKHEYKECVVGSLQLKFDRPSEF